MSFNTEQLERLAALEHEQWTVWSKNIMQTEHISLDRRIRWDQLWRPYAELTEKEKEQDRVWARKVIAIIGEQEPKEQFRAFLR
ncbi:MAG: hypothetical protein ACNYVW_00460 [Methanosarcinales archaeon]